MFTNNNNKRLVYCGITKMWPCFLKAGFWLQGEVGEKGYQHLNNEEKHTYTKSRSIPLGTAIPPPES